MIQAKKETTSDGKTVCKFSKLNKYLPNTAVLPYVNRLTQQITAWCITLNTSQSFNWSTHSLLSYNYKVHHNVFTKHNYSKVTDRTTEELRFNCQQDVYTRHMPSQCSQGQLCWSTIHVNIVTYTETTEEDSYFDCFLQLIWLILGRFVLLSHISNYNLCNEISHLARG